MMKSLIFIFVSMILFVNLNATIINVPADTSTIQGGINLAVDTDTVLVQPGTYYENINFNGKNIVVGSLMLSTGDTSYISQTVIDGRYGRNELVTFCGGEDTTAIFCGFTLTKGYRGIFISNSHPKIFHLKIHNNFIQGSGGGIYCDSSNALFENLIINVNYAEACIGGGFGGGIYVTNSSNITLKNAQIIDNMAGLCAGGIACRNSNLFLQNVIISNNFSNYEGGGLHCESDSSSSCNLLLNNVTIAENIGSWGGGIFIRGQNINIIFEYINRCNIYNNIGNLSGCDLYCQGTDSIFKIVVDTFTVLNPDSSHAYPMNNYTFDIQNASVTNILENPYLPNKYLLSQNYPNPFNPKTNIQFTISKSANVKIKIFNLLGQKITTLLNKQMLSGSHEVEFTAKDLPSGVYLYRIQAGDPSAGSGREFQEVRKMILLK